jgi:hypothetical protein
MGVTSSRPGRVDPDLSLPLVSRSAAAPAATGAGLVAGSSNGEWWGKQVEYAKANMGGSQFPRKTGKPKIPWFINVSLLKEP